MLSFLGSSPTLSLWLAHRVEIRKLNFILALIEETNIQLVPQKVACLKAVPTELQIAEL